MVPLFREEMHNAIVAGELSNFGLTANLETTQQVLALLVFAPAMDHRIAEHFRTWDDLLNLLRNTNATQRQSDE